MKKRTKIILISAAAAVAAAAIIVACVLLIKKPQPSVPPYDPPPLDFKEVVFYGVDDAEVLQGRFFDCFKGITAKTDKGEDVTPNISLNGEVNTSKAGEYTLTYSVGDFNGNVFDKSRKITVIKNDAVGKVKPVPVYSLENGATYNVAKGCEAYTNSALTNVANAFDGDFSSRWESVHGVDGVSLTVNLGASVPVNEINIYWEASYAKSFTLSVSENGADWQLLKTETEQTLKSTVIDGRQNFINTYNFDNLTAQFVKINCLKRSTAYGYSIWELQVKGPTGTVIPKEIYPDLFNAQKEGEPDWKFADKQWVNFDLGALKAVDTVRIAFKGYITPATYRVAYAGADGQYKYITLKNLPYSADTFSITEGGADNVTVNARYFKIEMTERRFYSAAYRINEVKFSLGGNAVAVSSVSASSSQHNHGATFLTDGNDQTYWESQNGNAYQTIDLKSVKAVGRVDLYWRGDDGGKGKFYDLQISLNGTDWTTVFRQTHGATSKQSVYVYENAKFIRIIDYQSHNADRFMLEGMVVCSQYPQSSGEGKIEYDTSLAFPEYGIIETENGSYVTGGTDFPSSRLIAYLDESLRGKPVPSNDWWQGLLVADKGYNMFMNPLTATFKTDGLWLTNPGEGYFDGFVPGNGSQTVNVDVCDVAIGYAGMSKDATVRVTGYSDYGISAVMTDDDQVDKLTAFLSEGALYAYCLFAEPEKALIKSDNLLGCYDLQGKEILKNINSEYTGDAIAVKVLTHSGYVSGIKKYRDKNGAEHENEKLYEERYYVVSVPADTRFKRGEGTVSVIMQNGNYLSLGAVSQKNTVKAGEQSTAAFPAEEVKTLHDHGYAFVMDTSCTYSFSGENNEVTTVFRLKTLAMRKGYTAEAYSAYLPHQLEKSNYTGGKVYKSVRGDCRSYTGNAFVTKDIFYGVVPTFTEPTDGGYSAKVLYEQLLTVYANNGGDKKPEDSNLISGDPYWQGKNLHPMAMAALASDQIGATDLRDKFLDKIEYILTDWFTYDKEKDAVTGAYFYYDGEWGTLYYKNSEFGAGVNLADHYFTYGYYTLAAGVLAAYRPDFANDWGDMIELLIRDYMNPERDDELFPYMRNFDPFAGHGWAGGYADNNSGNNQESAGEALNSWVGAYLYATAVGDEKVRQAAIYGYTTELNAIKHYWFNYFNDFSESYQYGVAGQVYGGSNFYGTFFNGEPLYMYGIHLIPGEEYLTSYAYNDAEREKLEGLLSNMRKEQAMWDTEESHKTIYAWQHIFIPITAIYDADEALDWYDEVLREQGNVGNTSEQFNVYWLIHGMKSAGLRTTDIWAKNGASATVYKNGGKYTALCWNPTGNAVKFVFADKNGETGSAMVPARSLTACNPMEVTLSFVKYRDVKDFAVDGFAESKNVESNANGLAFSNGGEAAYKLTFGSREAYYSVKISSNGAVRLYIDGEEAALEKTDGGYKSKPLSLSFKHTVTLKADGVNISDIAFEELTLVKSNVSMSATASSDNENHFASYAVDGDMKTRWESKHKSDGEWLLLELSEQTLIYQIKLYWEAASAREYKIYFSKTGKDGEWTQAFHGEYSQGGDRLDLINPSYIDWVKYIKIEGISRITDYGYSVYEVEIYNFDN